MRFIYMVLVSFTVLWALWPVAGQAATERQTQLRLIAESNKIEPGETLSIAVEQTIAEGWHTYWVNPGDSGEAMSARWTAPDGFSVSSLQFPAPARIPVGPLVSYGYERRAVMVQDITAPASLPAGKITLDVRLSLLVCADICIPEQDHLTLVLNDPDAAPAGQSAFIEKARAAMPAPYDLGGSWHYRVQGGDVYFTLLDAPSGLYRDLQMRGDVSLIPYEWGVIENSDAPMAVAGDDQFYIRQKKGERDMAEKFTALLSFRDEAGRLHAYDVDMGPVGTGTGTGTGAVTAQAPQSGFMGAILFALLGGLILNLMPCVFPVLSMKAMSLVKMGERERKHAQIYSLYYTAGILVCFLLLAAVLILLREGGAQIGWGFQFQNPLIVLSLSLLFFVLGLNMSGLFEMGTRLMGMGAKMTGGDGARSSFLTGMLAAIVATPCTAPFMGVAIGYAMTQPRIAALSVFVALGVGLALPFLLLSFVPSLQRALPKPGAWMQTMRELLAFPLYASAAWLVWVYTVQTSSGGLLFALMMMVVTAFLLWLGARMPKGGVRRVLARLFILLMVVGMVASALIYDGLRKAGDHSTSVTMHLQGGEEPFTPARLSALLENEDRPVFVNMTAAWCITCKVNERVALNTKETRALFATQNIAYLKGDWTNENPDITAYLAEYGRNGVPLYVFYGARGADGARPEPVVLPQILTQAIMRDTLSAPLAE